MVSNPGNRTKPSRPKVKPRRRNTKRTGELSEAAFLLKASSLGFAVTKPWGDSERYDFILDTGRHLWRVQIKCTSCLRARAYEVRAAYTGRIPYTRADIDFLVAHIVPLDLWYVLPVEACTPAPMLRFYPHGARCARFEQYKEAWHLLRPKAPLSS